MRRLQATGVSDQAMADAIQVCALFNIIDRVADSLEFDIYLSEYFVVVRTSCSSAGIGR